MTLSASAGWAFGPNGYTEAMAGQAADVRTGRSFCRDSVAPRAMTLGAAFAFYTTTEWRNGLATKNQRHRCSSFSPGPKVTDVARGWYPVEMAAARTFGPFLGINEPTGLDGVGYPTPEGILGRPLGRHRLRRDHVRDLHAGRRQGHRHRGGFAQE